MCLCVCEHTTIRPLARVFCSIYCSICCFVLFGLIYLLLVYLVFWSFVCGWVLLPLWTVVAAAAAAGAAVVILFFSSLILRNSYIKRGRIIFITHIIFYSKHLFMQRNKKRQLVCATSVNAHATPPNLSCEYTIKVVLFAYPYLGFFCFLVHSVFFSPFVSSFKNKTHTHIREHIKHLY